MIRRRGLLRHLSGKAAAGQSPVGKNPGRAPWFLPVWSGFSSDYEYFFGNLRRKLAACGLLRTALKDGFRVLSACTAADCILDVGMSRRDCGVGCQAFGSGGVRGRTRAAG